MLVDWAGRVSVTADIAQIAENHKQVHTKKNPLS